MLNANEREVRRINDIMRRNNVYYWAVYGPASYPDVRTRPDAAEGC